MLQLIIKDFRANGVYQLLSLLILFIISTVFILLVLEASDGIEPELVLYTIIVALSSSSVSLLFFFQDEVFKTDEIFVSLPVTRREVVLAKYATSILQLFVALFVHFLGLQLGVLIHGGSSNPDLDIITSPIYWLSIPIVLLLFKSYAYPLYFKFGLAIGALIHTIIQFLLIVIVILSAKIFNFFELMDRTLNWVSSQNGYAIILVLGSCFLIIMSASMILSIKLFKNKEI